MDLNEIKPVTDGAGNFTITDEGQYVICARNDNTQLYFLDDSVFQFYMRNIETRTEEEGDGEQNERLAEERVDDLETADTTASFWSSTTNVEGCADITEVFIKIVFERSNYAALTVQKAPKKKVWDKIANSLILMGHNVPALNLQDAGIKCNQKYRNLIRSYKRFIDKSSKTGSAPLKPPSYYDLLHPHLSKRHDIKPQHMADSLSLPSTPRDDSPDIFSEELSSYKLMEHSSDASEASTSRSSTPFSVPRKSPFSDNVSRPKAFTFNTPAVSNPSVTESFASRCDSPSTCSSTQNSEQIPIVNPESFKITGRATPPTSSDVSSPASCSYSQTNPDQTAGKSSRHSFVKKTLKPKTSNRELLDYMEKEDKRDRDFRERELIKLQRMRELQQKDSERQHEQRETLLSLLKTFLDKTEGESSRRHRKGPPKKKSKRNDTESSSEGSS